MKRDYKNACKLSRDTKCYILNYYKNLYINFDMKRVGEIAVDCDMHESSIRNFFDIAIKEPNSKGEFDPVTEMILLCTKFGSSSPYRENQKLLSEKIRRRKIEKQLKTLVEMQNKKGNLCDNGKSYK